VTAAREWRVVVAADAEVGEGPVWDERSGELVWVDIPRGRLHRSDLAAGRTETLELGTLLGAAAPRASASGYAVAVADGFGLVEEGVLHLVDPVLADPVLRMNDAKCDPVGRLWAGSTHLRTQDGRGRLHRWDGAGPSSVAAEGLTLPNGIGWSPDAEVMYLADSLTGIVHAASFDVDTGDVGALEVFARIDSGLPDGLAVGADGHVWVAVWDGARVCRFDERGVLVEEVPAPVRRPSSCAFGDGSLYVTTARSQDPGSGSVFAFPVDVAGVPVSPFCG
jgi:sugar lactone lactonase YvrE